MDETANSFPQVCHPDCEQKEKGRLVDEQGREIPLRKIPAAAFTALV